MYNVNQSILRMRGKKKIPHVWGVNWGRNDVAGGFPTALFGFRGVSGEFGDETMRRVGFPPCRLGSGWYRGRNDMAGGFPAMSFGFWVVLGEFGEKTTRQVGFLPRRLGSGVVSGEFGNEMTWRVSFPLHRWVSSPCPCLSSACLFPIPLPARSIPHSPRSSSLPPIDFGAHIPQRGEGTCSGHYYISIYGSCLTYFINPQR